MGRGQRWVGQWRWSVSASGGARGWSQSSVEQLSVGFGVSAVWDKVGGCGKEGGEGREGDGGNGGIFGRRTELGAVSVLVGVHALDVVRTPGASAHGRTPAICPSSALNLHSSLSIPHPPPFSPTSHHFTSSLPQRLTRKKGQPTILAELEPSNSRNPARHPPLVLPALVARAEAAPHLGPVGEHLHGAVAARPAVGGPGAAWVGRVASMSPVGYHLWRSLFLFVSVFGPFPFGKAIGVGELA